MPLSMNREVFITCAVTGAGDTVSKSSHVPVTPKQIAESAIEAAKAGAAVVHCHVRDPETGAPARRLDLYREVTDRIRSADIDVVLNLTAGMAETSFSVTSRAPSPSTRRARTWPAPPNVSRSRRMPAGNLHARLRHDEFLAGRLRHDQYAVDAARDGTADDRTRRASGDRGLRHRAFVVRQATRRRRPDRGSGADPALHGHSVGRAGRSQHLHGHGQQRALELDLLRLLDRPQRHGLSRRRGPCGGNVRVGLEDNLYVGKGQLATNAQLVEKAVSVVESMGAKIIGPEEVRRKLKLTKR